MIKTFKGNQKNEVHSCIKIYLLTFHSRFCQASTKQGGKKEEIAHFLKHSDSKKEEEEVGAISLIYESECEKWLVLQ